MEENNKFNIRIHF